jgi:hypothetical protein
MHSANPDFHVRIAHPARDLVRSAEMYIRGLGLQEIGRFHDHDGFVFYVPDYSAWNRCSRMLEAGFIEVESFNPYWNQGGRTFQDQDGYQVVIKRSAWGG